MFVVQLVFQELYTVLLLAISLHQLHNMQVVAYQHLQISTKHKVQLKFYELSLCHTEEAEGRNVDHQICHNFSSGEHRCLNFRETLISQGPAKSVR